MHQEGLEAANYEEVCAYVDDIKSLLDESSITEQRAFLQSFVKSVEVGQDDLRVLYNIPMSKAKHSNGLTEESAVLSTVQVGSPSRIRTYDLAVNSRPLYR